MKVQVPTRYINSCTPAAVAAVTGLPRGIAAAHLAVEMRHLGHRAYVGTYMYATRRVLTKLGYRYTERYYFDSPVTVKRWLARHQTGTWLVRNHDHIIAVRDGEIIEDNGWPMLRAMVTTAIKIGEGRES